METLQEEIQRIIGQAESETLEYGSVPPPSRAMARILASFANTQGGYMILGINKNTSQVKKEGFSRDFHIRAILTKAQLLLEPEPNVQSDWISYQDRTVFAIKVEPSQEEVLLQGRKYVRVDRNIILANAEQTTFSQGAYQGLQTLSKKLDHFKLSATEAKSKFLEHIQSSLKIMDDVQAVLYPISASSPTEIGEGKILMRMLFSAAADSFEIYLSDLLYEIYLAKPESLRTNEQVSIKEVLNCQDMDEFIKFWSRKKIAKLQRGSVKGFVKENDQINGLKIIDDQQQEEIERILQIRHLYSHKNGLIDDKFLSFFPNGFQLNQEHRMSLDQVLEKMNLLASIVDDLDEAARLKFSLSTSNN